MEPTHSGLFKDFIETSWNSKRGTETRPESARGVEGLDRATNVL